MARLYANENFPLPVVLQLRALGHDVLTIQDGGRAGEAVPDSAVLDLATADDRAVITLNRRDFIRLHGQRTGHAGIIVCSVDPNFAEQAARIDEAIRQTPDLHGQLLRVHRTRS